MANIESRNNEEMNIQIGSQLSEELDKWRLIIFICKTRNFNQALYSEVDWNGS